MVFIAQMKSTTWHNTVAQEDELWNGTRSEDIIFGVLEKNDLSTKERNIYLQVRSQNHHHHYYYHYHYHHHHNRSQGSL